MIKIRLARSKNVCKICQPFLFHKHHYHHDCVFLFIYLFCFLRTRSARYISNILQRICFLWRKMIFFQIFFSLSGICMLLRLIFPSSFSSSSIISTSLHFACTEHTARYNIFRALMLGPLEPFLIGNVWNAEIKNEHNYWSIENPEEFCFFSNDALQIHWFSNLGIFRNLLFLFCIELLFYSSY